MVSGSRSQNDRYFKEVFDRYYRPLCYYIGKYIPEPELADDICQDIFVSLWKRFDQFESLPQIESFLFVSARNACLNQLDHIARRQKKHAVFKEEDLSEAADEAVMAKEFDRLISSWLQALPKKCSEVVKQSLTGARNEEIAQRLGISVNTVKNQKVKGFRILRKLCDNQLLVHSIYHLFFF